MFSTEMYQQLPVITYQLSKWQMELTANSTLATPPDDQKGLLVTA